MPRSWRLLVTVLAIVPAAYAGTMGATGVPTADGCAGVGPTITVGWSGVQAALLDTKNATVPTANDGFHYLTGYFLNMTDAEAVAALTLDVRDASGAAVPGSLFMIRSTFDGDGYRAWVGWHATGTLSAGAYSATLSATTLSGPFTQAYTLDASAQPPAPLAAPTIAPASWAREGRDSGNFFECTIEPYCQVTEAIGDGVTYYNRVEVSVVAPPIVGTALWEYWLTVATGGELDIPAKRLMSWSGQKGSALVTFGQQLADYCLDLHALDLVSGATVTSQTCFPAGVPTSTFINSDVCQCQDPLPSELLPRWCAECASPGDAACAGVVVDAGADADAQPADGNPPAGDASSAGGGSGQGGSGQGGSGQGGSGGASARATSASGGCACSVPGAPLSGGRRLSGLSLVALLALGRRRRRAARNRTR